MTEDQKKEMHDLKEQYDLWKMDKTSLKHVLSWYGWGSATGLGLFIISIGVFLWLLQLAHIIH